MNLSLNRRWLVVPALAIISQICVASENYRLISKVQNDSKYAVTCFGNDEGERNGIAIDNGDGYNWMGWTWGRPFSVDPGRSVKLHGFRIPWDNQPSEKMFQVSVPTGPFSYTRDDGTIMTSTGYNKVHQLREIHYQSVTDHYSYMENGKEQFGDTTLSTDCKSGTVWFTLVISSSGDVSLVKGVQE